MRRVVSVVAGLALLAAVAFAVVHERSRSSSPGASGVTVVHGVIGSEKQPFFADPRVQQAFRKAGFEVDVDTAGSREIATTTDLSRYDFAFPAGAPAAEQIRTRSGAKAAYVPFFTPMAVATFTSLVEPLTAAKVVTAQPDGVPLLDLAALRELAQRNVRWADLPGNTSYPARKSVLVTTTDVRKSNSAAMYLSAASFSANGENVVEQPQALGVADAVAPLFLRQGFVQSSTEEPFEDYLTIGIGKTPLVLVYEAQFRARQAARDGSIRPDMTLLYLDPTVLSKHTVVPLTADGDRIGRLLSEDVELQHLAVQYGFRTKDTAYMTSWAQQRGLPPPPDLVNIVDPPAFETLEAMINRIGAKYDAAPTTTPPSPSPAG